MVDHFHHLVKLANDALTRVRRRVTWDLRDRRGRRIDPEWANRRRLLCARERLSDKSFAKMWNAIVSQDDTSQILSAWIAKEELRTLLSTVRVGGDPHLTRHRLHRFLSWCIASQIPEQGKGPTLDTWWPEINAFVTTGSPTPAPRATTGWSNRSNGSPAGSGIETTRPDGYDSTAPANSGPQPGLHADCPVKIESCQNRRATNAEKGIGFNVTTNTTNARPDRGTGWAAAGGPLSALDGNAYGAGARAARGLPVPVRRRRPQLHYQQFPFPLDDIGMTSGMGI